MSFRPYSLPRPDNMPTRRAQRIASGEQFYRTGKPCVHGHVTDRYISGQCVACANERSIRRNRPWLLGSKQLQIDRIKEEQKARKELTNYYDED